MALLVYAINFESRASTSSAIPARIKASMILTVNRHDEH